jgi:hypothetical protein
MNISYIILAHKGPKQVARLIEKLITNHSYFYIHIDKDVDVYPFRKELSHLSNVFFLAAELRRSALWADVGMVQATINCIKLITAHQRSGYCVLLSGQDYPIKSTAYINNFFKSHYGVNFIQGYPITPFVPADEGSIRIHRYKINLSSVRNDILIFPSVYDRDFYKKATVQSFLALRQRKSISSCLKVLSTTFQKRTFPSYLKPYKGSQWWALPIETLFLIEHFIEQHPDYLDYHLYTFAPDEIFFHSIIFSLIDKKFIRDEVTYVEWPGNNMGPLLMQESNINTVLGQGDGKLFARKFDMEVDARILDMIDRRIENAGLEVITGPLRKQC